MTTGRPECVQDYLDAAQELFAGPDVPAAARGVATDVFKRLRSPASCELSGSASFEACAWLDVVLNPHLEMDTAMGRAARAIEGLRPVIRWSRREKGSNGSANYVAGHANGMICGPGGIEERDDVHMGLTVMAPDVRYPEHRHAGEEAYVLLTPGEFRTNDGPWFAPGIGGGLHNIPWTLHAMRSGKMPLLTLWCLKL